jgi:hypothetical protein
MVESHLTPAHPHPLEALLNEPLTSTFNHAAAQGSTQILVRLIVDVITMRF